MTDLLTRRDTLDLVTLANTLNTRRLHTVDVVAPAERVYFEDGRLVIAGQTPELTENGVTDPNGVYAPSGVGVETLGARLDVPSRFLKGLHEGRTDLFDDLVNGKLHGPSAQWSAAHGYARTAADNGPTSLYRLLTGDGPDATDGVLRAVLSPRYRTIDDFDVLMATLSGLRDAGLDLGPGDFRADVTHRRMVVRVRVPQVAQMAPAMLAGYRSPFTGAAGADNPLVFAGFRMTNSEVGSGAFRIVPEVTVQVCDNGMTITKDATKEVHLGGELAEGIQWSDTTRRRNLDLVSSKTADVVKHFLSPEYLASAVAYLEDSAGVELAKPEETLRVVAKDKSVMFTEAEADGILGFFVRGGQMTAGGVLGAVTAYSQTLPDADRAHELDMRAVRAMQVAARAA